MWLFIFQRPHQLVRAEGICLWTHMRHSPKTSRTNVKGFWKGKRAYNREVMFVSTICVTPGIQSYHLQAVSLWASCLTSLSQFHHLQSKDPFQFPLLYSSYRRGPTSRPREWKRKWWATCLSRSVQNCYLAQPPLFPLQWDQNKGWPWPWHQGEEGLPSYSCPTASMKFVWEMNHCCWKCWNLGLLITTVLPSQYCLIESTFSLLGLSWELNGLIYRGFIIVAGTVITT